MTAHAIAIRNAAAPVPGLSAPMPTGDGLLVRLHADRHHPARRIRRAVRGGARHGNGIIEITSRGSIQVRGLSAASAPRFAADDRRARHRGGGRRSGSCQSARRTRCRGNFRCRRARRRFAPRAGAALAGAKLAPKSRSRSTAAERSALTALPPTFGCARKRRMATWCLRVGVGGDGASAVHLGSVAPDHGVEAAVRLLDVIAQRGRDARARDIVATEGTAAFRAAIADLALVIRSSRAQERAQIATPIGTHPLRDGSLACGIGLAFGHADARSLERLAEAARAAGASGLRAAPGRALHDDRADAADRIGLRRRRRTARLHRARRRSAAARRRLRRRADLRVGAYRRARARAAHRRADRAASRRRVTIHISGCAKGCAHAAPAALTVVGTPDGCALVANGSARDAPFAIVADERTARSDCADSRANETRGRPCLTRRLFARRRGDLRALVRHHPRRGRSVALFGRRSRRRGAHDPCLRPGRSGAAHRVRRQPRRRGARRARRRRADPLRRRDGGARHYPRAAAGAQRRDLHAQRSAHGGARRKATARRARRRRSICGATASPARWSPSAMRRRRCSACSI